MRRTVLALGLFAAMFAWGCGPQYPSCETEANCPEEETCVFGQCQQCAHANDCSAGQRCVEGRCE